MNMSLNSIEPIWYLWGWWIKLEQKWHTPAAWATKNGQSSSHFCRRRSRPCPPLWSKRQILDGIFYQLKNGCNWCDLPCIPTPLLNSVLVLQTVARNWSFRRNHGHTPRQSEPTSSKKPKWTTLIIIDSQAVKNTCNASVASKCFCHYKVINGIKRHLAYSLRWGNPSLLTLSKANVTDDQGLIQMLLQNIDYFKAKPVNIAKITILVDHGYHPEMIQEALEAG